MSQKNTENSKKTPRDRFQNNNKPAPNKSNKAMVFIPLLVGLALIGIFVITILFKNTGNPVSAARIDTTDITYPVSLFADGRAQHFNYTTDDGLTIRYFIVKSSDGVIRAAFDACDVCWPADKGYYQKGDYMVCRNCGRRFASERVNEIKGGCNPAPLARKEAGDKVVIQVTDIFKGKQYFNFSNGGLR